MFPLHLALLSLFTMLFNTLILLAVGVTIY